MTGIPTSSATSSATDTDTDTGTVTGTLKQQQQKQQQQHTVTFVNPQGILHSDMFSASWLQSRTDFMDMNVSQIGIVEDAAFHAWITPGSKTNPRLQRLKMTTDYLDFSVEHLSKWFKRMRVFEPIGQVPYETLITKLQDYIVQKYDDVSITIPGGTGTGTGTGTDPPIFHQALALIAFQPYLAGRDDNDNMQQRAFQLTVSCLAATIESIRRAQMGRVVVVASEQDYVHYTEEALQYLRRNYSINNNSIEYQEGQLYLMKNTTHFDAVDSPNNQYYNPMLGHMEVAFVTARRDQYQSHIKKRNIPKGALAGVQEAFQLVDKTDNVTTATANTATSSIGKTATAKLTQEQRSTYVNAWLGTRQSYDHWKYLYLTEPDSILTTRTGSLEQLKQAIDVRQGILSPWRLQPIAHESDIRGYNVSTAYLHESDGFDTVWELDHSTAAGDACCDEPSSSNEDGGQGKYDRIGEVQFPPCGTKPWYMCGLFPQGKANYHHHHHHHIGTDNDNSKNNSTIQHQPFDPHERLRHYALFRLTKGTGLVTIAATQHARRCFPTKGGCSITTGSQNTNV